MSCPTCGHTMQGIGYGMFHCPRCGTVQSAEGTVTVPALVERCRKLPDQMRFMPLAFSEAWYRLGIEEAINTPENRR
jgi:hypothetical protein